MEKSSLEEQGQRYSGVASAN